MKIVLLNGPPRSGKDTAAELLHRDLPFDSVILKFAEPLRSAVPAMFGIHYDDWLRMYLHEKETPQPCLMGHSVRSAMIWLSESVMKPNFGNEVFGRIAVTTLHRLPAHIVVISDCGFESELRPVIDAFGRDNLLVLQIDRNGCTFANDSRNWVQIEGVKCVRVDNNGSVEDLARAVTQPVTQWLNTGGNL